MEKVSVIISSFNGLKYLPRLLANLRAQRGVEVQIIVVDRHSSDGTAEFLAEQKDVLALPYPPEHGLVAGYHFAVGYASHELYFFMNEDMWMEQDCLFHSVNRLRAKDGVAAVMPVQWTYDGKEIVNAGIWYEGCFWNRANPLLTVRNRWHLVKEAVRVSYANAGACLVSKEAYAAAGGWDTSFFLDDEDVDLAIRFWQRGWQCWVEPLAIIGHAVGASNSKSLVAAKTTVSQRRYISACSNTMIMAFKTFSVSAWPRAVLAFLDRSFRDVLKLRWERMNWNIKVARLTLKRLGDVAEYRRTNAKLNAQFPGQQFFRDADFQYAAISHCEAPIDGVAAAELTSRI
jgi:GT2 family glycosyltransferase